MCVSISICYTVSSQLSNSLTKSNGTVSRRLPFTFFMDVEMTPWYEIVFLMQSISMGNIGVSAVGLSTVGPCFIMAGCGYLRSLGGRFEQLNNEKADQSRSSLEKEVISCVMYHQQLLELVWETVFNELNIQFKCIRENNNELERNIAHLIRSN